jgi:hypothetical protein
MCLSTSMAGLDEIGCRNTGILASEMSQEFQALNGVTCSDMNSW